MKILPVGAELFDADRRIDRQTCWRWQSLLANFPKHLKIWA